MINGWSTGASKALRDQIQEDSIPFISESFASEVLDPQNIHSPSSLDRLTNGR